MPSDIFISYAREDRQLAGGLASVLQARGWSVWWDRVIPPGETWDEVIESELTAARAVIVIWSSHSIQSRWVRSEASEALDRHVLIPVRFEEVIPPLAFRHMHAADLVAWSGDSRDERLLPLFDAIGTLAPLSASQAEPQSGTASSRTQEPPLTAVSEGELRRISDLFHDWEHPPDQETAMLSELEIRETIARYLQSRGENRHPAHQGDLQTLRATAKRLGLLR